jgi:2,4-dienoyl-CoA reductase-like NADH-dependent reductase (Old Yellow Enzyme family)
MKLTVLVIIIIAALSGCMGVSADRMRLEAFYVERSQDAAMAYLACVVQTDKDYQTGNKDPNCSWTDCPGNGWTTLSINRHPAALPAIAQLTAIGMDAHASETRECVTLERGREVLPYLKRLNAAAARTACVAQWQRVRADTDPPRYPDVKVDEVCNSLYDIERIRDDYIKRIEAGQECWPWFFDD